MSDETTVLLIRHGQTKWNKAGLVQGNTDSALTALGEKQAAALAEAVDTGWLPGDRPSALYSSDLGRTIQTATPLSKKLNLEIQPRTALREMNFGELEGLKWAEVESRYPDLSRKLWGEGADPHHRAPSGETRIEMHERSKSMVLEIASQHAGETVVIVSHGGVIGFFVRSVLGLSFTERPRYSVSNGSIAAFRIGAKQKMLSCGLQPPLP